jgi:hypothetical protein
MQLRRTWVQLLRAMGEEEAAAVAGRAEIWIVHSGIAPPKPSLIILGLPTAQYNRATWKERGIGAAMETAFRAASEGQITDCDGTCYDELPIRYCMSTLDSEQKKP